MNVVLKNHAEELNAPLVTLRRDRLKDALFGEEDTSIKAIISADPITKPLQQFQDKGDVLGHVWVDKGLVNEGFNEEYLNTPITGKRVFVPFLYGTSYLPTTNTTKYVVLDSDTESVPHDGERYREVIFENEQTIADLYCNAYRYSYSPETDTFLPLPQEGALQNTIKPLLMKEVMLLCGDAYDRIADLSRIVLFLLSKVELTETEADILAPLLEYAPNVHDLAPVAQRERNVQALVAQAKANPIAFIQGESAQRGDAN